MLVIENALSNKGYQWSVLEKPPVKHLATAKIIAVKIRPFDWLRPLAASVMTVPPPKAHRPAAPRML
jgi:hypothetical protein